MKPQGHIPSSAPAGAHQGEDLNLRAMVGTVLALVSLVAGSILVVALLFHFFDHFHPHRTSEAEPRVTLSELPPAPRLQAAPATDLQTVQREEDLHLTRYAWVEKAQGVAQIPIDRAMVLWVRTYVPPSVNAVSPSTEPISPEASATNAPPMPATELQMRQQKAQENPHVP